VAFAGIMDALCGVAQADALARRQAIRTETSRFIDLPVESIVVCLL
jgi:hypothetical protein